MGLFTRPGGCRSRWPRIATIQLRGITPRPPSSGGRRSWRVAAEDRNWVEERHQSFWTMLAAVVRDGRGSQRSSSPV